MNMNIQTQPTVQYPTPVVPRMAEYQYTLVISYSDHAENPREWDNLGTFVSFDSNSSGADEVYNHGPEQYLTGMIEEFKYGFEQRMLDKDEFPTLDTLLEIAEKYYVILPVFKYEHSGVEYNTTGFSCRWDSGQIGFIYVSKEDFRKAYGWKRITKDRIAMVNAILSSEIKIFSQWANGNVYGFQLYYHDVEEHHTSVDEQDSCWGFYHNWAPNSLETLRECGIADHLPDECLNDRLKIVFEHW